MVEKRSRSPVSLASNRTRRHLAGHVHFGQDFQSGRDLWLKPDTLATHMQVIGGTRTGKTFFLEQLARELMALPDNRSVVVLDPHGSLYYALMDYCVDRLPPERVVFFNPLATPVIGYNPMLRIGTAPPYYQSIMMMEACRKVWGEEEFDRTPRLNRWLFNACMAVIEAGYTLEEMLYMLNPLHDYDPQRRAILEHVSNEYVRRDWEWFLKQKDRIREERTESSANRLKRFVGNEDIRNVLSRQQRVVNFDDIIKNGKILLVNLAAHDGARMTSQETNLLGTLLVNDILAACFRRPKAEREAHPAYLIMDEFQHFVTKDICIILNEGRKFGLHLVLAHHHLGPIRERDPEVYYSVLTNAATKVVFGGLSIEDAEVFARQLYRFNLDERKLELYAPYDQPVTEWVDIVSESEGSAWHQGVANAIQSGEAYRPDGFLNDELVGTTKGKSTSETSGSSGSSGRSVTHAPMTTHVHQEILSSVQFRSLEEQVRRAEEQLIDQPTQYAAIKVRGKKVTFFKVPTVKPIRISNSERAEFKDRVIESIPYYATLDEIKAEHEERREELRLTDTTSMLPEVDIYPEDNDF